MGWIVRVPLPAPSVFVRSRPCSSGDRETAPPGPGRITHIHRRHVVGAARRAAGTPAGRVSAIAGGPGTHMPHPRRRVCSIGNAFSSRRAATRVARRSPPRPRPPAGGATLEGRSDATLTATVAARPPGDRARGRARSTYSAIPDLSMPDHPSTLRSSRPSRQAQYGLGGCTCLLNASFPAVSVPLLGASF